MSGTRSVVENYSPGFYAEGSIAIKESDGNELDDRILVSKANATLGWNADGLPVARDDDWYTFTVTIGTQGDTGTPSQVLVTRLDADGAAATGVHYIRARICNDGAYATAATATIAAGTTAAGSAVARETHTSNKDITFESQANGITPINVTDGTAETVTLRIGMAPLTGLRGDYSPTLDITHAAP